MPSWTTSEYKALKAAVASGTLRVSYSDRSVQYHSLDQMRSLLSDMERSLGISSEKRYTVLTYSRDLA